LTRDFLSQKYSRPFEWLENDLALGKKREEQDFSDVLPFASVIFSMN